MAKRMTDKGLSALVRSEIDDAAGYDKSGLSAHRARAMDYYDGVMADLPAQPNRSSVTSRDMSEAIGWILPGLMRVFASGDRVAEYEPTSKDDEQAARQATDYVNHVFYQDCDGYRILHDACMEALKLGNGLIKVYWDDSTCYEVQDVRNIADDQWTMLAESDDVDVLQHTARTVEETVIDPMTGAQETVAVTVHDARLRRVVESGKLKVETLPPEEFLIQRHAKSLADATFLAHRRSVSRADLIAQGFDRDEVMRIGSADDIESTDEMLARHNKDTTGRGRHDSDDPLMEEVEVFECYIKTDFDGDDWPEWRKVVMGASGGRRSILANDEWTDPIPFVDLCAMIVPHRWEGRSILDEVEDIQRIKTVLMRQTLDNLYLTNNPQRVVQENGVVNMDELLNPQIGGVIIEKMPGAIRTEAVDFVAAQSFQMVSYLDEVSERRTGVSRTAMALDPDALQNQTAAGAAIAQSAAYAKIELYARNIAMGLRTLFRNMLRLLVTHQDKAKTIRLRGDWIEMDPRAWNAEMDATVNVGLGSGSRDRDIAILQQIMAMQREIVAVAGPFNPICGIDRVVNTARKMVEISGARNVDSFFAEITTEKAQEWFKANMGGGEGPTPEEQKVKAQIEGDRMKAQAQFQLEQMKMAATLEMEKAREAAKLQAERERAAIEIQMQRERAAAEMQLMREKAAADLQLRREEMALEAELTAQANRMKAATAAPDLNIEGP